MTRFCIICGKLLTGRQRILCSDKKCHKEWTKDYDHKYYQNNLKKIKERKCEFYQNNLEEILERNRERYQNNREEILEQQHEYRQNNQRGINERARKYRQNNLEKVKKRNAKWRQDNPGKILELNRKYRQNNQEKVNGYGRKHYRRVRGLSEDVDLHKESGLEIIMREWLQKNNIEFIEQYYINFENSTWTWVDFYIPEGNICLYCDGNYYHLLPEVKKRDANQNRILPQMGYNVIRMTEIEILEGNCPWELKN